MLRSTFLWTTLLIISVAWLLRLPPIDDAYITFRYAENLLRGNGLVYNAGEPVLGVTTPLWALLLAGARFLDVPFELFSQLLGFFGYFAVAWFLSRELRKVGGVLFASLTLILAVSLFPIHAAASSGMEAVVYTVCVWGIFTALQSGHPAAAGFLAASACLLRPDGLVALGIGALWAVRRSKQDFFTFAIFPALLCVPWIVYATNYYGSPLPHSIHAKRSLYPSSALTNLLLVCEVFSQNVVEFCIFIIGAGGLLYGAVAGRNVALVLWTGAYLIGIVFSGIRPIFFWYFLPVWLTVVVFGWCEAYRWWLEKGRPTWARAVFLIALTGSIGSTIYKISNRDDASKRDDTYREIVATYRHTVRPGDKIYVGEVGIVGYGFMDSAIIDGAGINSPSVVKEMESARAFVTERGSPYAQLDRFTDWSINAVRSSNPDWIIGARGRGQLIIMEETAWFQERYQRDALYMPHHLEGIAVYRRAPAQ